MRVEVYADAQAAGRAAARKIAGELADKPDSVLGLATGHTMIPVYGELVRLHEEAGLSFARAATVNLDEYVGLSKGDPDSFYEFMNVRLISQVDLPRDRFFIPNGKAVDLVAECARYEEQIQELGGIDLQLLGLGRNGHIGFNEPGSPRESRTRVVELSEETRRVNAGDFRVLEYTPARAITMGVATILEAGKLLLVVTGWEKTEILYQTLTTPPTPDLPASFLHEHPQVTVVADQEALELYFLREGKRPDPFSVTLSFARTWS